ncbi:rRNA maturation RNase YbeY [Candidatus Halobeggiatoa sp. HSG11]|nr:rRNA maturation RNase YbeY [Candidatus Halobeggiatoa sp. HSG11]
MGTTIDLQCVSDEPDLPNQDMLSKWVNAVLEYNTKDNKELTIRLVDITEAQQLNFKWRQRNNPTNVLSFPFECPPEVNIPLLGDIVICVPLVATEAAEQHKSLYAHWAHLVIHGTLHLLGYDHIDEQQAQLMENIEVKILKDLGYPNPYHLTDSEDLS